MIHVAIQYAFFTDYDTACLSRGCDNDLLGEVDFICQIINQEKCLQPTDGVRPRPFKVLEKSSKSFP